MKKKVLVTVLSGVLFAGHTLSCSRESGQSSELKTSAADTNAKIIFGGSGGSEVFTYKLSSGCSHHSPQYTITTAWKKLTVESESASFGEKYFLDDWTGKVSKFVRNGGYGSPVIESTIEFKDGPTYQDVLGKIEKIVAEVKEGNFCTNSVPELQQGIDFVQDHKTVFGKRAQTFELSSGCSHHSERFKITTQEGFLEVYSGGYTFRRTLKVSLSPENQGVISQEIWRSNVGATPSIIKLTEKQEAKEALEWMKSITEKTLNGNECTRPQTNLVEAVSKIDALIMGL
jgi:hypothetical protein